MSQLSIKYSSWIYTLTVFNKAAQKAPCEENPTMNVQTIFLIFELQAILHMSEVP